jgi:hypothetical protein
MPIIDQQERAELFQSITEELQEMGDTQSNLGVKILTDLWTIYQHSLYSSEEYTYVTEDREIISQRFETFVEFCDEVIRPHYDPADYFDKFKWVVERVFRYIYIREQQGDPIIIPLTDIALTVELLLETKGWISKLIIISNKIEMCQTDEEIEALFSAGFLGDVAAVKQAGEDIQDERIEIHIDFIERPLADRKYNLFFESITAEQYSLILRKMGKILVRHFD